MATEHQCGPAQDKEFFEEIAAVMKRYPDAANKYLISCVDNKMNDLKINHKEEVFRSRIEGRRIITEVVKRSAMSMVPDTPDWPCCEWYHKEQPDGSIRTVCCGWCGGDGGVQQSP